MKYVMLIYQGPALERQAALTEEEQKQVRRLSRDQPDTGRHPRTADGAA